MDREDGARTPAGQELTSRESRIREILSKVFSPTHIEIIDDSGKHAGHAGAAPGGETHYTVRIRAAAFESMSRVARQRAVMQALSEEFETGLHALSIKADV